MKKALMVGFAALAALAAAGIGYATIPGGDGEIHACYDKQSGQLRIYDSEDNMPKRCGSKEEAVSWSQIGPSGPQGPKGDKGEKGDAGPPGAGGIGEGSPCVTYDGDEGTIELSVAVDDTITLICTAVPPDTSGADVRFIQEGLQPACPPHPTPCRAQAEVKNFGTVQTSGPLAVSLDASNKWQVSEDDCTGATLTPGAICNVWVTFTPLFPQDGETATLSVFADPGTGGFTRELMITAIASP